MDTQSSSDEMYDGSAPPSHTHINWTDDEEELLSAVLDAKDDTGLTYKQLLSLGALAVKDSEQAVLQKRIGQIKMLKNE